MLLGAAELTIDHVTVAATDLKAAQARLVGLGIPSEYGGPHSNHATEMALTSFPNGSYLELIAIQPKADAGPTAWAVRTKDVVAELRRLRTAGVVVSSPVKSGRERPDGTRLDWEAANVGLEPNGTFFPFLIRDFTPRQQRAFPTGKPTTTDFSGVAKVVIAVRNLKASVTRYQQAYALEAPALQADASFGASLASFVGTPVVLAAPLNAQSWLAPRLERFGEGPCAFILGGKNGNYDAAAKTRWFGADISWFDTGKLGWRLGFER